MHNTYPIDERNELLLKMFENLGFSAKLIGNKNQPKIVIDDSWSISGYVHNKLYHFTTKPFNGEVVKTVSLTLRNPITREELDAIIASTQYRQVWKLSIEASIPAMFYVKTENFTPIFAPSNCRFFFDLEKTLETQKYLFEHHKIMTSIHTTE